MLQLMVIASALYSLLALGDDFLSQMKVHNADLGARRGALIAADALELFAKKAESGASDPMTQIGRVASMKRMMVSASIYLQNFASTNKMGASSKTLYLLTKAAKNFRGTAHDSHFNTGIGLGQAMRQVASELRKDFDTSNISVPRPPLSARFRGTSIADRGDDTPLELIHDSALIGVMSAISDSMLSLKIDPGKAPDPITEAGKLIDSVNQSGASDADKASRIIKPENVGKFWAGVEETATAYIEALQRSKVAVRKQLRNDESRRAYTVDVQKYLEAFSDEGIVEEHDGIPVKLPPGENILEKLQLLGHSIPRCELLLSRSKAARATIIKASPKIDGRKSDLIPSF